jgi:hypothetical protein
MAKLNTYVHVHDPDKGTVAFGPGDDVPAWAKKHITRDDVWATGTPAADDDNPDEPDPDDDGDPDEDPDAELAVQVRNVGSGWYEIVAGGEVIDKIRGKDAATAAAEAVAAEASDD